MGSAKDSNGKRKALLEAALQVFATKGYHGATVKDIVEAAQVATGTFYLYFPSKQNAFAALIDHLYLEAMEAIRAARQKCQGEVSEKLGASIEAILKFFNTRRDLARIILVAAAADPVIESKITDIHAGMTDRVRADLDFAVSQGLAPQMDTRIVARALVGSIYEVVRSWLLENDPDDLEKAVSTLLAYNLRGVGIRKA